MRKMTERTTQLHRKFRKRLCFLNISVLMIAAVLILSLPPWGALETYALGGMITGPDTDTFWNGIPVPAELKISQDVTVNDSALNVNETYKARESGAYVTGISTAFQREGSFQPVISTSLKNSHPPTWKNSSGNTCYFSSLRCESAGAVTYYWVSTDQTAADDMGNILLEYYKTKYSQENGYRRSEEMMITTEEKAGEAFRALADACAKEYGWKKYTGEEIPFFQNGRMIRRVEMLTVNPVDYAGLTAVTFNFGSLKLIMRRQQFDLDMMLYTSHSYVLDYTTTPRALNAPEVKTQSGYSIPDGDAVSEDDVLILVNEKSSDIAVSQYCLSGKKLADTSGINWSNYTGPIELNGEKYLYVRSSYANGEKEYIESDVEEYEIHYMDSPSAIVSGTPENGSNVDVGGEISVSQNGAASDAAMFYTVVYGNESAPTLSQVSYADRQRLLLDELSSDGKYVKIKNENDDSYDVYMKINGIWYQSSDASLKIYTTPVTAGEALREKNYMTVYVLVGEDGKELGEFQSLRYSYRMSRQTEAPESTIATSSSQPASVKMGTSIGLLCNTTGSRIFYTTNGSAPVITIDPTTGEPVAGANTKEYKDDEPIVVNVSNADYGKSFLIMAQAVTYTQIGENYYPSHLDSPIVKFQYKVEAQSAVEPVRSVPQTNADTPTEVTVGSKIQLFSDTEKVKIFYTLDGSEPLFDEKTLEPGEKTYLYSGSTGVLVTRSKESSLFTITAVAYKEGLAVSNISRMVFAYPGAVSSPYANPSSGAVAENTQVLLKTATENAVIYYELAYGDEIPKDPGTSSKVFDESMPIFITQKTTIKALAVKNSMESTVSTFTYTVSEKLSIPVPSISTGAVVAPGTVISLKAADGAVISYTLDGSNPKDSANKKVQVGNKVVLNGDAGAMILLRTYASKEGYSSSEEGSYSYTISNYTGGIYADRENGEILKNWDTVSLHTDMSDAIIYYTTDGSTPTEDSRSGSLVTIHGEPGEQVTVMAMAVAKGSEKTTSFATFTYTIMNQLAAPTASVPDGAVFTKESVVELKAESGKIYYTTDGSEPSDRSNLYKKSIVIDRPVTIKAIAVADDLEQSEISTFVYGFADQVAAPLASYASGELEMGTKVSFSCATEGASIYYRTDGGDINLSRKSELELYTEPITVNKATNFKVIAVADKMQDSKVLTVGYTVREPVVIETPEEEGSQYQEGQSNRLQSRRSFSEADAGPSYTDVVLRNAAYGAVVAAEENVLPEAVKLDVAAANVTDAVERRVKQVLSESFGIVASYDVKLLTDGEETQPDGEIEIGLPIPVEYENAMLYIVHVQEDGNIELYETRRSGGIAYAKVEHLSVYSIAAPVEFAGEEKAFPWLPVIYTAAVSVTGLGIWMINKARKARREEGMRNV